MVRCRFILAVLAVTAMLGCTSIAARAQTVFAATDLKLALDELSAQMAKQTGRKPVISYGDSSALARQIESGAPADVFIAADALSMDYLAERKLIRAETRGSLLGNRLALVSEKESRLAIVIQPNFPLAGILGDRKLAMPNIERTPTGRYGKAALESLGVWDTTWYRIVQTADAQTAVQMVLRREALLGIVYITDALAERKARVVWRFPENSHPAVTYSIAVTQSSTNPDTLAFVRHLASPAAKKLWEKRGFTVLSGFQPG